VDVTQLYRAYVKTCGHVGSVELWNTPTGATYRDDAYVIWGHSPVNIDSHKLSSWKVVHQCVNMFTMMNNLSAAQFVTTDVDGTVTSNDTCIVISRPSRSGGLRVCVGEE